MFALLGHVVPMLFLVKMPRCKSKYVYLLRQNCVTVDGYNYMSYINMPVCFI